MLNSTNMKKIISIFIILFVFSSCSKSEDTSFRQTAPTAIDPNKLIKIIISPNTSERVDWNFNTQGLLSEIVKPNGILVHTFTYDSTGLFLTSMDNTTFTYSNNRVSSINGLPLSNFQLSYDQAINKYLKDDSANPDPDEAFIMDYFLNADGIVVSTIKHPSSGPSYYCGGIGFDILGNAVNGNDGLNLHIIYTFDNKPNPLINSLKPIYRALSVFCGYKQGDTIPNFMMANFQYSSTNNPIFTNYDGLSPESTKMSYIYNSLDLPKIQTIKNYYSGALESSTINKMYYYQGDIIPL